MLYYFKTKFLVCCHLSVSTEGHQVHIRYTLYPVSFGNDDKSLQNKLHIEITVQLCGINFEYVLGMYWVCTGYVLVIT